MRVFTRRQPHTLNVEVFIISDIERYVTSFNFKEDGECVATVKEYAPGTLWDAKPTMTLPEREWREVLRAFQDIAKEEGIEPHTETFAKGKLESQSAHLQDLRKLLKL